MDSQPTQHLTTDQLEAYIAGTPNRQDIDHIEQHLAECQECNQILQLPREAHPEPSPQETRPLLPANAEHDAETIAPTTKGSSSFDTILSDHTRYHVLEKLGQGGMGAVYKAEHKLMQRTVALKVINPELVTDASTVERFRREVQAAGRLDHPNIVRSFDADQAGDVHFLVMEYVQGTDLYQLVKERGPLSINEACDYIRQAAVGLQHAYENGMVHRDIKPQNLMLTEDGQVKILDFGLASLTTETVSDDSSDSRTEVAGSGDKPSLTQAGTIMGTPDYMAPEQVQDASSADIRADIYSLGCTLYFLLTGDVPFPGGSVLDKVIAQVEREVRPIRQLRRNVPRDLVKFLVHMMVKNPAQRPQTPAEIASALEPFVAVKPTRSRSTLLSWIALFFILIFALLNGAVISVWTILAAVAFVLYLARWIRNRRSPITTAHKQETRAVGMTRTNSAAGNVLLLTGVVTTLTGLGTRWWWYFSNDALLLDESANRFAQIFVAANFLHGAVILFAALLMRKLRARLVVLIIVTFAGILVPSLAAAVIFLARLPMGQLLIPQWLGIIVCTWVVAVLCNKNVRNEFAQEAIQFRLRLATLVGIILVPVLALVAGGFVWSQTDRGRLVVQFDGSGALLTIRRDGQLIQEVRVKDGRTAVRLPLGRYDIDEKAKWLGIKLNKNKINISRWHEETVVVTRDRNVDKPLPTPRIKWWKTRQLEGHTDAISVLAVSPDGELVISGALNDTILMRLWNVKSGTEIGAYPGHNDAINALGFSADGKQCVSGSDDKTVRVWDALGSNPVALLKGHQARVTGAAFLPNGKQVVSTGFDQTLRLWDVAGEKELQQWQSGMATPLVLKLSPDGNQVFLGGVDGHIEMWDMTTRKRLRRIQAHDSRVFDLSFSPKGDLLASGGQDKRICVWDVHSGKQIYELKGHTADVRTVAFLSDGEHLISGGSDKTLRIWHVKSQRQVHLRKTSSYYPNCIAVLTDGYVASAGGTKRIGDRWARDGDYAIHLWRLPARVWSKTSN